MPDGTEQLRYFMSEGADYIHSMAFSNVMTNWISPGGLFIGMRRLIFTVQPDDLFLGSYVWNITTHSNPVGDAFFYRITADDLQNLAKYVTISSFFCLGQGRGGVAQNFARKNKLLTISLQLLRPNQPHAPSRLVRDR
jgi:hypothetical protein